MKLTWKSRHKELLISLTISLLLFGFIQLFERKIIIDKIIEMIIIGSIGLVSVFSLIFYKCEDRYFKRFELFLFFAYTVLVIQSIVLLNFLFSHSDIYVLKTELFKEYAVVHLIASLKVLTFILETIAFYYFYLFLKINEPVKKRINVFMTGFVSFFVVSLIISIIAKKGSVAATGLFLAVSVGIISLFFFIQASRYLGIILILSALIHIWEASFPSSSLLLHSGINNAAYWFVNFLYLFEVINWIKYEKGISYLFIKNNHSKK